MRFTKSRIVVTRPRSIIGCRFSNVEESLFYSQASAMHFALEGLRVRGWLAKGVGLISGGVVLALLGFITLATQNENEPMPIFGGLGLAPTQNQNVPMPIFGGLGLALLGAWILFRDKRLGTMRFLDHERTFDMHRSDFDELYSTTLQLQGKLMVTMTELNESIDDVEPDNVFERVSAAAHCLLAIIRDPKAEHFEGLRPRKGESEPQV